MAYESKYKGKQIDDAIDYIESKKTIIDSIGSGGSGDSIILKDSYDIFSTTRKDESNITDTNDPWYKFLFGLFGDGSTTGKKSLSVLTGLTSGANQELLHVDIEGDFANSYGPFDFYLYYRIAPNGHEVVPGVYMVEGYLDTDNTKLNFKKPVCIDTFGNFYLPNLTSNKRNHFDLERVVPIDIRNAYNQNLSIIYDIFDSTNGQYSNVEFEIINIVIDYGSPTTTKFKLMNKLPVDLSGYLVLTPISYDEKTKNITGTVQADLTQSEGLLVVCYGKFVLTGTNYLHLSLQIAQSLISTF